MPRRKPSPDNGIPQTILDAVLLNKKKITRKGLSKYQEQVLLLFAPEHLVEAMKTMLRLVKGGDLNAVKLVLQMHNLIQAAGGISVTTNIQQNTASIGGETYSFDAMMRRLADEQKPPMMIEAHTLPTSDIVQADQVV